MNANSNKAGMQECDGRKKLYATPQVLAYGTIHEITQAVGMTGKADGGMPGTDKTSP